MEIKPKFGFDKLLFGMKKEDVAAIYGAADKEYKDEDGNLVQLYNAIKTRLTFYEEEDFRLGYLIVSKEDATVAGIPVIRKTAQSVQDELKAKGFSKWTPETFDSYENFFNEANWTILQSEFGEVIKIELGAIINEKEDEFEWKFNK